MSAGAPSLVQPWLLLGERRRRSLENRIRTAAERWAAQWVSGTVTPTIAVGDRAASEGIPTRGDRRTLCFGARSGEEWLAQWVVPRHLVAWAAGLGAVEFSATADLDEISFSGEIELAMLRALWDLLLPQALAAEAPLECLDEAYAEEARLQLAKRGIRALCSFGATASVSLQMTLSPSLFATLLAERPVSYVGESLLSRRSAVAQAPVPLECCLGSVQVPVRDLHSLRIGDVLVTDITLDGRAELRVRNKPRPIAAGTLGTVEGRKALKIETAQVVTANRGSRR
jgi:flagellar motor switch/type III secretory pathway protein FliN